MEFQIGQIGNILFFHQNIFHIIFFSNTLYQLHMKKYMKTTHLDITEFNSIFNGSKLKASSLLVRILLHHHHYSYHIITVTGVIVVSIL